jgi:hypothetical protein
MQAAVEARLERARHGGLGIFDQPGPDPVVTQPALWEIRWSFSDDRELRLYHGEPLVEPDLLLGLKYHWKRFIGLNQVDKQGAQNEAMTEAAKRFRALGYDHEADA